MEIKITNTEISCGIETLHTSEDALKRSTRRLQISHMTTPCLTFQRVIKYDQLKTHKDHRMKENLKWPLYKLEGYLLLPNYVGALIQEDIYHEHRCSL